MDHRHCGDCNTACAAGEVCNGAGACELSCRVGQVNCGGTCVEPGTDRAHCGAGANCAVSPGTSCAAGEVCNGAGACELSCQAGLVNCAGTCTSTSIDPNHCGDCGIRCPDRPNSQPVCATSECAFVCDPGHSDCDGVASNGCEAILDGPLSCGACGNVCGAGVSCNAGVCALGLDFDGSNDTLTSTTPLARGLVSAFTAEYWIYPQSRAWMKLLSIHNADNRDIDMELRPDGLAYCTLFDQSGNNHGTASVTQLPLTTWTHVACSWDGTTQRMFVNGVQEAQRTWSGQLQMNDVVSISGFESRFVDGVIDEFRLSETAVYTSNFTPPVHLTAGTGTVVRWLLDEGAGSTTADGSGNGFTGALGAGTAAPAWVPVVR